MTTVNEILDKARDTVSVRDVYGEPIVNDGVTIIPVARVMGLGGGGSGTAEEGEGAGYGYGLKTEPVGVYVIKDGKVKFEPAVNVNSIVAGSLIVGAIAILTTPRIIKRATKLFR